MELTFWIQTEIQTDGKGQASPWYVVQLLELDSLEVV